MKLTKLEIKKMQFPTKSFKDAFEIAVNSRLGIAEVGKFTYLKSFLIGDAAREVKALALTKENYVEVTHVFDDKYGYQ